MKTVLYPRRGFWRDQPRIPSFTTNFTPTKP